MSKLFLPNPKKLAEEGKIKELLKAIQHKDNQVKLESLRALNEILTRKPTLDISIEEKLHSNNVGEILQNELNHDMPAIRQRTLRCIGLLGDKTMVQPILQRLPIESKLNNPNVLEDILDALGELEAKEAVNDISPFVNCNDELLSLSAAKALAKIGYKQVVPLIIEAIGRKIKEEDIGIVTLRGLMFKYYFQIKEILKELITIEYANDIKNLIQQMEMKYFWVSDNPDAKNLLESLKWMLNQLKETNHRDN